MKAILSILFLATLYSCSTPQHPYPVERQKKLVTQENVRHYGDITFSSQLSKETIEELEDEGYDAIINLRSPEEFKEFDQKALAEDSDLLYYNIPLLNDESQIQKSAVYKVAQAIKDNEGDKVLIYCSSGNRAGAWLGAYLYLNKNVRKEAAISTARKAGMSNAKMEKKLRAFLNN